MTQAHKTEWIDKLRHFNAHYALRRHRPVECFKPFTKGFIAAHCACPVLADLRDQEARCFLPESYPYFADTSGMQSVITAIERMRSSFVGAEWNDAQAIMRQVKDASSCTAVAVQLRAALAPEL